MKPRRPQSKQEIDLLMSKLSNWGRWGIDDQMGRMNLLTPNMRSRATRQVKEGVSISLGRLAETESAPDNPDSFNRKMMLTGANNPGQFAADVYTVAYHGHAHTHIDSLGHMFYRGKMYNGIPQETITDKGSAKLSVTALQQGILACGVLVDIARLSAGLHAACATWLKKRDIAMLGSDDGSDVAPLAVSGGTGSPVNPIATF